MPSPGGAASAAPSAARRATTSPSPSPARIAAGLPLLKDLAARTCSGRGTVPLGGCLASGLYATGQLRSEALVGWLLAACNAWSAFFLMLCLAYCLVQLPRHLWRLSTPPAFVLHLQQLRARRQRERRGAAQARAPRSARDHFEITSRLA